MKYILDTNTLITAKNSFYAFAIVPSFWRWLDRAVSQENVILLDVVMDEIRRGGDELTDWTREHVSQTEVRSVKNSPEVLQAYRDIGEMVYHDPVFAREQKEKFMSVADPWLIAAGKVWHMTVVTFERMAGAQSKKVKIPDIAQRVGVRTIDLYELMQELGVVI